jgi:hypothetical protein
MTELLEVLNKQTPRCQDVPQEDEFFEHAPQQAMLECYPAPAPRKHMNALRLQNILSIYTPIGLQVQRSY